MRQTICGHVTSSAPITAHLDDDRQRLLGRLHVEEGEAQPPRDDVHRRGRVLLDCVLPLSVDILKQ